MDKENIYIIIPVHNRKAITLMCLETLKNNGDLEQYQIVIVDDGSTDGTSQAITEQYPNVIILPGDGNLWWTGAMKLGMEYAHQQNADYIIWLNDDCNVPSRMINALLSFANNHFKGIIGGQGINKNSPHNILFGGKIKTWQGYRFHQAISNEILPCDLLSGNIVCFPRSLIDDIGYPNPNVTPHYGGDSLYLIRAIKAGYSLYVDGRYNIYDISSNSPLYPHDWLLGHGDPLQLLKLAFNPNSGLSWRVWLVLNWEAYQYWGIIMFLKKYISLLLITVLRFIPIKIRRRFFSFYP